MNRLHGILLKNLRYKILQLLAQMDLQQLLGLKYLIYLNPTGYDLQEALLVVWHISLVNKVY